MSVFRRAVKDELDRATALRGPMRSLHEGYAALKEEVDELWDEIKKKSSARSTDNLYTELVQIAAMANRMAIDVGLVSS